MRLQLRLLGIVVTALAVGAGAFLASGGEARADGGPHGGYQASADAMPTSCASCHRAHSALSGSKLLDATDANALCLTCHGGSGSLVDVVNGVRPAGYVFSRWSSGAGMTAVASMVGNPLDGATGSRAVGADQTVTYTVAVRNTSGGSLTIDAAVGTEAETDGSGNPVSPIVSFGASAITEAWTWSGGEDPGTGWVPGAGKATVTLPEVVADGEAIYLTLEVTTLPGAVNDHTLTTPVAITETGTPDTLTLTVTTAVGHTALNTTLLGGGFVYQNGKPVTSKHLDPLSAAGATAAWGFGSAVDTGDTGTITPVYGAGLTCVDCHDPHGSDNYRIIRDTIQGNAVDILAFFDNTDDSVDNPTLVKQEGGEGSHSPLSPADKYVREYYGSDPGASTRLSSVDSFCGACHTAYAANAVMSQAIPGGHYRHVTEDIISFGSGSLVPVNPETSPLVADDSTVYPPMRLASKDAGAANNVLTCMTCHYAHGSSATWTSQYHDPPSAAGDTALMYLDNVGVCEACHRK